MDNHNRKNIQALVRYFPNWLVGNEEDFLDSRALKGWRLYSVSNRCVYTFVRTEPGKDRYAVEVLGAEEHSRDEIEADEAAGWEYIGTFDRRRYYRLPVGSNALMHPAADAPAQVEKLASTMTNLTTLLLLNIPGTLYSIVYALFFLYTNGFQVAGFSTLYTVYLIGAPLGIVSIGFFLRWLRAARRRRNKMTGIVEA